MPDEYRYAYVHLNPKWRPKAIETTLPQAILSRTARALGLIAEREREPFRIWHTAAAALTIHTSMRTLGTRILLIVAMGKVENIILI